MYLIFTEEPNILKKEKLKVGKLTLDYDNNQDCEVLTQKKIYRLMENKRQSKNKPIH